MVLDPADMSLFCPDHAAEHSFELEDEEEAFPEYNFALPRKLRVENLKAKKRYGINQNFICIYYYFLFFIIICILIQISHTHGNTN